MDIFIGVIKAFLYVAVSIFALSMVLICLISVLKGFNRKWKNNKKTKSTKRNSKRK